MFYLLDGSMDAEFLTKSILLLSIMFFLVPINALGSAVAYATPYLIFFCLLLLEPFTLDKKNTLIISFLLILNLVVNVITGFYLFHYFLSLITYSSILFLILSPKKSNIRVIRIWFYSYCALGLVLSASIYGYMIYFGFPHKLPILDYSPDLLGSFYEEDINIGPHLISITLYLLSCITFGFYRKLSEYRYLILSVIFFFSGFLPQFNSATLSFILASLLYFILSNKNKIIRFIRTKVVKKRNLFLLIILLMLITTSLLFSHSKLGQSYFWASLESGLTAFKAPINAPPGEIDEIKIYSGKVISNLRTFYLLPQEKLYQPIVGIGLGTYSSRSALISSGEYLDSDIEFLHRKSREVSTDLIFRWWNRPNIYGLKGTIDQPWSSVQSIYAEMGVVGVICFIILFSNKKKALSKLSRRTSSTFIDGINEGMTFALIFFVLICFFGNFIEYPWVSGPFLLLFSLIPSS